MDEFFDNFSDGRPSDVCDAAFGFLAWRYGCNERFGEWLKNRCTVVPIYEDCTTANVTHQLKLCLYVFNSHIRSLFSIARKLRHLVL